MRKALFFAVLLLAGLVSVSCDPLAFDDDINFQDLEANLQEVSDDQQEEDVVDDDNESLLQTAKAQGIQIKNSDDDNGIDLVIKLGKKGRGSGAVTYVRWGRSDCPQGANLVYAGRVGGSHYTHKGGGSNYQCLTMKPENFDFGPGTSSYGLIYGAEYETNFNHLPASTKALQNFDVPCAVCLVKKRTAKVMIPGTYKCPTGWRREYYGYLMSERHNHFRSTFECVDKDAEGVVGTGSDKNGALFYFIEPRCGSLPCPLYDQQKEMTCAVCTY